MTTARVLFDAAPLASQSANGKAMTRSMTVTVSAIRSVRRLTPNRRVLTTQLYFDGDPYNDGDPFLDPSLIMPHRTHDGLTRARFDFVLAAG